MGLTNSVNTDGVLESVSENDLPESVLPILDTYDDVLGDRDRLFWQWLDDLFPAFTLSCVDPQSAEEVRLAKLLVSLLVTVIDDVAEKHDDRVTFAEAATVPIDRECERVRTRGDEAVVAFVETLWDAFEERFAGPRAAEFEALLQFDLKQVIDAIDYSQLINRNLNALNERELWVHDVHNMAVFVYADIDLAYSPSFDATELSALRAVVWHTERIARICNWIATWERELHEGDCSSGLLAYARDANIVSLRELQTLRADPCPANVLPVVGAVKDHDVETVFLQRLEEEFEAVSAAGDVIESIDVDSYLDGFEVVRQYHVTGKELL